MASNICQALPAGVARQSRAAATAANTAVNVASNQPQSLAGAGGGMQYAVMDAREDEHQLRYQPSSFQPQSYQPQPPQPTEGRFDWEAYQREQNQIYLQQQHQMQQRQQELAPPRGATPDAGYRPMPAAPSNAFVFGGGGGGVTGVGAGGGAAKAIVSPSLYSPGKAPAPAPGRVWHVSLATTSNAF